jgi:hypothetical protein
MGERSFYSSVCVAKDEVRHDTDRRAAGPLFVRSGPTIEIKKNAIEEPALRWLLTNGAIGAES